MLNKLKASTNLYLLVVIMSIFIMGIGAYGIKEMDAMNENTQTLYADRVFPLQQLTTIRYSYAIGILSATEQARTSQLTFEQAEKQVEQAQETIATNWNAYMQTYLTPKEKQLAAQEFVLINQSTISIEKLKTVLDKKNPAALDEIINNELYPAINPVVSKLNELIDLQVNVSGEVYKNSNEVYTAASGKFLLLIFLSLVFAIILSYYLIGNIKDMIKNLWKSNAKTAESEEKYRSLIEHAGDPIFLLNEDRSFNDLNSSACKLLGYSREEFKSLKITDVYTVEELEKRPLQWDVLGKNKAIISERRLRRKDKTEVDVEFNIRVLEGKGYLAIARDITERKNAERIIKASEEKYRSLVEHAGDAIFMVGADTSIIDVNQSACELFGYTRQEFQHMKALDLHPSDESRMLPEEWDLLWKNKTLLNERRLQRKDGTKVEVEISRKLLPDGQGYLAIVRDITERKKSEEKLKHSEARLKEAQAVAHMGNWEIDMINDIHIWSDELYKIFGVNKNEVTPSIQALLSFIHPDEQSFAQEQIKEAFVILFESTSNFRFIRKDTAAIRYALIEWRFEFDDKGTPVRLYGILQDITERTEAAANLKLMEKAMSEEKLKKQQEITRAVISAQEKERAYLGEELHDNINQILATSKLYIEVAIGDRDVRKDLMTDSRLYLMNAMEEIRKLSKSLLPPSLDGESLRSILTELIANIEQVKQINFIKEWDNIDESSIHEKASLAIFRIVQEQLNNILKYAGAKTVVISLEQNGNTFQLRIKDDGVGFDTSEKRKGIGLKNIVSRAELLNGDMAINSSPGEGCELIVNFNTILDEV